MASRPTYRRPAPRRSNAPIFLIGLLCTIILLGCALILKRPDLIVGTLGSDAAKVTSPAAPRPTDSAQRQLINAVNAVSTDAERQTLNQAIPTPIAPLITGATPAPVVIEDVTADQARHFSPVDLGNAPLPTPTTMLSQEQFDAAQASEEQNQLNTAASGLTPAQRMVQEHDAEQRARAQP